LPRKRVAKSTKFFFIHDAAETSGGEADEKASVQKWNRVRLFFRLRPALRLVQL
jgi:hypothetical protein